jgi:hypothetical protein
MGYGGEMGYQAIGGAGWSIKQEAVCAEATRRRSCGGGLALHKPSTPAAYASKAAMSPSLPTNASGREQSGMLSVRPMRSGRSAVELRGGVVGLGGRSARLAPRAGGARSLVALLWALAVPSSRAAASASAHVHARERRREVARAPSLPLCCIASTPAPRRVLCDLGGGCGSFRLQPSP